MPILNIWTNVSLEGFDTSAFLAETTPILAELTGKPIHLIFILLKGSVKLSFGGTEEPAALADLTSIGGLNKETNKEIVAALTTIFQTKFNVPKNRLFVKIYDSEPAFIGWNGTVF